jgi:peptide deformylase
MKLEIVKKGNKVLETPTKIIPEKKISSKEIQGLIVNMHDTLLVSKNGVALAATQVGSNKRLFVVSPNVFDMEEYHDKDIQTVLINPKIIWQSKDNKRMEEGCLSILNVTGYVKRSTRVTVEATDKDGNKFELEGKGLLAQIFQHEIDHLDGVLFDSKAADLRNNE